MPSSRKQPYVLFCQERAEVDPALKGLSLPKLVAKCSDSWKALSPDAKSKYADMAKQYSDNGGVPGREPPPHDDDWRGRFDCYGRSMLAIKLEQRMHKSRVTTLTLPFAIS